MFYFDEFAGKRVLKSDLITDDEMRLFFTTRDFCVYSKTGGKEQNFQKLCEAMGDKVATNHAVHGTHIEKVEPLKYDYEKTDGLILEKGAAMMSCADCVPIVFYVRSVGMLSHAGWRGTAQNMAKVSVQRLINDYHIKAQDIKAVIGPAICGCCYEVGLDVFEALKKTVSDEKACFLQKNGHFYVDIKKINEQQLKEVGVEQIDVCPYCTACGEGKNLFFSYRYENATPLRHSAVIQI